MSAIPWRPGKPRKEKEEPKGSVCPICQAAFSDSRRKYCSDKCANAARSQREQRNMKNMRRVRQDTRKCHDCGRPTTDYRCPACWQKLRQGVSELHRTDGGYIFA